MQNYLRMGSAYISVKYYRVAMYVMILLNLLLFHILSHEQFEIFRWILKIAPIVLDLIVFPVAMFDYHNGRPPWFIKTPFLSYTENKPLDNNLLLKNIFCRINTHPGLEIHHISFLVFILIIIPAVMSYKLIYVTFTHYIVHQIDCCKNLCSDIGKKKSKLSALKLMKTIARQHYEIMKYILKHFNFLLIITLLKSLFFYKIENL